MDQKGPLMRTIFTLATLSKATGGALLNLPLNLPFIDRASATKTLPKSKFVAAAESIAASAMPDKYPTLSETPLSAKETAALAAELDAIRDEVMADLGEKDALYIRRVYAAVAYSEIAGRLLLLAAALPKTKRARLGLWLSGVTSLSLSKILNNMELGHNVMHGQYDWMQDNHLNSRQFDWDNMCPAPLWQHSHNYLHHTFTNIVGRDHDVGYHLVRITDEQPWQPHDRFNLLKIVFLAMGFEWAVGFHDVQISFQEYKQSDEFPTIMQQKSRALLSKVARQVGKDYFALPLAAGVVGGTRSAAYTLSGNITANIVRNIWTWGVIFCGHFTEQAHIFTHLDDNETRGDWYVRQMLGSSNITGSKLFHIMTGNLSHQIEHHLFPDMPANRYASIAPRVAAICKKYNLSYNTGPFSTQLSQVIRRIYHFSWQTEAEKLASDQAKTQATAEQPAISNAIFNDELTADVELAASSKPKLKSGFRFVSDKRKRFIKKLPPILAQTLAYV